MYNKIRDLCAALNKMSRKEMEENGIAALIIFGLDIHYNGFEFSKGRSHEILSLIGSGLTMVAKQLDIPIEDLANEIVENEKALEMYREKEGD